MYEHSDQVQMGLGPHSTRRKWMWWSGVAGVVLLVMIVLPSAA
jgi:hypothetical protein